MKTHPHANDHRGFTLIELLVVISIIALLAGIAIPTGNIVLRKARETQARAGIHNLIIAVKGYQTEYNRFPTTGAATGDQTVQTTDGNTLLPALMKPVGGAAANPLNPRQISFFEANPQKGGAGGLTPGNGFMDPWGHPYTVVMDADGDGQVANPFKGKPISAGSTENEPDNLSTEVVAYSKGYDQNDTSKALKSWR